MKLAGKINMKSFWHQLRPMLGYNAANILFGGSTYIISLFFMSYLTEVEGLNTKLGVCFCSHLGRNNRSGDGPYYRSNKIEVRQASPLSYLGHCTYFYFILPFVELVRSFTNRQHKCHHCLLHLCVYAL